MEAAQDTCPDGANGEQPGLGLLQDSGTGVVLPMLACLPEGIASTRAAILVDAVFHAEHETARRHGVSRATVARVKAEHRAAFDALKSARGAIVGGFAGCAAYGLARVIAESAASMDPAQTPAQLGSLVQSLSHLARIAADFLPAQSEGEEQGHAANPGAALAWLQSPTA